jgi:hypothetical protein
MGPLINGDAKVVARPIRGMGCAKGRNHSNPNGAQRRNQMKKNCSNMEARSNTNSENTENNA